MTMFPGPVSNAVTSAASLLGSNVTFAIPPRFRTARGVSSANRR